MNSQAAEASSGLAGAASRPGREYRDLFRYIAWLVGTSIPTTALVVAVGILSGSLAVMAITIDYGLSLGLNSVALVVLGIILRQNKFKYPYGTGKLENFSGFIYGLCIIPLALAVMGAAVKRYLHPPEDIDLGLALLFFIALIRLGVFAAWITRLGRRYPEHSPLLQAYYLDYRASFINEAAIFGGLVLGLALGHQGGMRYAVRFDLAIAAAVAVYLLYNGGRLLVRNVRALIDLPLEEDFQMKIMQCLAREVEAYAGLGNVYTRWSGTTRRVQIELQFDPRTPLGEIDALRRRMEQQLREPGRPLVFHLIPLPRCGPGIEK